MKSHQGTIEIINYDTIRKNYNDKNKNNIKNEIYCINKFSKNKTNLYSPEIISVNYDNKSYLIRRYDFELGTTKKINESNLRRILFSISIDEIFKQFDEILKILNEENIIHRDINPGNLLFDEKNKKIILIDFYWAITDSIKTTIPKSGINGIYGIDDEKAFEKIKNEILEIYKPIPKQIKNIKKLILDFGKVRFDGSVKHISKSYQKIDIPYFNNILYHRNTDEEFNTIFKNISNKEPKIITDIGCASGYNIFNLIRNFKLEKAIGYEYDPIVNNFLLDLKRVFYLNEFKILSKIDENTKFEKSDITICMNVHMWLYKQLNEKVDIVMNNMINNSKELFFQTAGAESHGMFLVNELNSKEKIYEYLMSFKPDKVEFIRSTENHGGIRHLFKVCNY